MIYKVKFRETTTGTINVEASSIIAAIEQAKIDALESVSEVLDDKIRILAISEDEYSDEEDEYEEFE